MPRSTKSRRVSEGAAGTHSIGVDALEQHHSPSPVAGGKVQAIIVELNRGDDVSYQEASGCVQRGLVHGQMMQLEKPSRVSIITCPDSMQGPFQLCQAGAGTRWGEQEAFALQDPLLFAPTFLDVLPWRPLAEALEEAPLPTRV